MQALYWAWSHAIPIRLQRLQGGSPRLQSAAPEAATGSVLLGPEAVQSSSFAASAQSAAATEASVPCSPGEHTHLSAQHYRELESDRRAYSGVMALQRFKSCGNMTLVQLHNSSKNVWTHTVILALRARH